MLRRHRCRAVADPQGRWRRARQRAGQGSVEQAGRPRRMEHRHVAALQHRGRDDRVRDCDRGGRLAGRLNSAGDRGAKAPGTVVARPPRGRLFRGRRRAAARGAMGSASGIPQHLVDPGVRGTARARCDAAPTPGRRRVPRDPTRAGAGRLPSAASPSPHGRGLTAPGGAGQRVGNRAAAGRRPGPRTDT